MMVNKLFLMLALLLLYNNVSAQDEFTRELKAYPYNLKDTTVIGSTLRATIRAERHAS